MASPDRPRLSDEELDRLTAGAAKRDGAALRAYHAHMEGRERTWTQDVLCSIGNDLRDVRRLADDAGAATRINGARIDGLAKVIEGTGALLDAHEARLMERLAPLHAAATRAMQAQAVADELAAERERIEIDARRKEVERQHAGAMSAREMLVHSLRTYPWFWVLVWLAAGSMGLSVSELGHLLGVQAPTVEAGAP